MISGGCEASWHGYTTSNVLIFGSTLYLPGYFMCGVEMGPLGQKSEDRDKVVGDVR